MAKEFRRVLIRNVKRMILKIFFYGKKTDEDLFRIEREAEHEEGRLPCISTIVPQYPAPRSSTRPHVHARTHKTA